VLEDSLFDKWKDYFERQRVIQAQKRVLEQLEIDHAKQTRADFGVADGDTLDIAALGMFFENLIREKEKLWQLKRS